MPFDPPMRARSRCIFSASVNSAPVPTFLLSTSIRSAPVRVSRAHRSVRSFSSARGRRKVSSVPSGDRRTPRGCDPDKSGLPKTRASVSLSACGAAAVCAPASAPIAIAPTDASASPNHHVRITYSNSNVSPFLGHDPPT